MFEIIRGFGANIIEDSVRRVCRAFFILIKLLFILDTKMNVNNASGKHTKKSVKEDLIKVVKTLSDQHVFQKQSLLQGNPCIVFLIVLEIISNCLSQRNYLDGSVTTKIT